MKNSKKTFILIEVVLGILVMILAATMILGNTKEDLQKISVVVQDSDDTQWAAFRYGLRMAAQDQGVEMFVVGTESMMTVDEQEAVIEQELNNGADAVIVQPVSGDGEEEMLQRVSSRVPVMLAGTAASAEGGTASLPIVEPDNYSMGKVLAEELLEDYAGSLKGKTLGIVAETGDTEDSRNRRKGFEDGIEGADARILWSAAGSFGEAEENTLGEFPGADIVIALDDNSLTAAGECAVSNDLHGAVLYGIGNSTEAVYYLDTGIAECLVVPDEFNVGYRCMTEVAQSLRSFFYEPRSCTVSHTVIRREEIFSQKNQELLFTMNQ